MANLLDIEDLARSLEIQQHRLDELTAENTALTLGFSLMADLLVASGHVDRELLQSETKSLLAALTAEATDPQSIFIRQTYAALTTLLLDGEQPVKRINATLQ